MASFRFLQTVLIVLCLIVLSASIFAEVPTYITYQGRLTDSLGNPVADVEHDIVLNIYEDDMTPTPLWSSGTLTGTPTNSLVSIHLGPILPEIFTSGSQRYLGIILDDNPEMAPRVEITSMPYAYQALVADTARYAYAAPASPDDDWSYDGDNIYHETGNVGIGNTSPSELLTIGKDIGSSGFDFLTIGNDVADRGSGLKIGEDGTHHGVMMWGNNDNTISISTRNGGSYNNELTLKNGNVGIGTSPPDTVSLAIINTYNLTGPSEAGYGIKCEIDNPITEGQLVGGEFRVRGGYISVGVKGDVRNASVGSIGGEFTADDVGIYAYASTAATLNGNVNIDGNLTKSSGSFKIDHPLDPENKYLQHSFVESPDMMNIYNGNITTDEDGYAEVVMPDYFEALNMEFRYQLTVIGEFAQAIIKEEIQGSKFSVMTDKPNVKVSWMVTGIRQDRWANEHRIQVEVDKPDEERGYYIAPELYGFDDEKSIDYKIYRSWENEIISD